MVAILSRDDIHSGNGDRVGRESLGLWEKAGKEGCGLQATLHLLTVYCSTAAIMGLYHRLKPLHRAPGI